MKKAEIEAFVKIIFAERFGDDALARLEQHPEPFKPAGEANRFVDDLDSLDHIEFIMALEEHFNVEIDEASGAALKTINDAVAAIETRLVQSADGDR